MVITHKVSDVDTWVGFTSERADAIAAEVDDVAGMMATLASPPPEMGEVMQRHGVMPPLTIYVER